MKSFWSFFVSHYRFTFIVIAAIICAGSYAILTLPKESDPEVDIPIAVVTTFFPGASPLDVEELVTDVLEDEIGSISGISSMESTSRGGLSSVVVEFDVSVDRIEVLADLEDAVDAATLELPEEAEDPVISEVTVSDTPFLQIALGGDFGVAELTRFAKQIESEIEGVSGVSQVQIIGGLDEEIQVIVNRQALDGFGIGIDEVTRAIASANSDIPIGAIETGGENFNIRLAGRLSTPESIMQVPVATRNDAVIRMSDVAAVQAGFSDQSSASFLSTDNDTSVPAVTLLVYKSSGGDITKIAQEAKENMNALLESELPSELTAHIILDLSETIASDLASLTSNGIASVIVVFVLLLFFLGFREALLASLAIPLSFLMAFVLIQFAGLSINFMTLFSLILALGILVDSAIVVNQAMYEKAKTTEDPFQAAKEVIAEFQWPLIAGTLTTVFAFIPMLLTSGIIGEYIKSIPITITSVLMSSLFVALALNTTLSAVFFKTFSNDAKAPSRSQQYFRGLVDRMANRYEQIMRSFFNTAALRKKLIVGILIALIVSYSFPVVGLLKINMFPTSNEPTFVVDVELPVGSPLEETVGVLRQIESIMHEDPYIISYVASAGQGSNTGSVGSGSEHTGYITVDLVEKNRPQSADFVDTYQRIFDEQFPVVDVRVSQGNFGPPSEAPVVVTIEGSDLTTLDSLAKEFETILKDIDGTQKVQSSVVETNGEFVLYVDRVAAQRYGLSTAQVAFALRNAIAGSEATSVNDGGDDVPIRVRLALSPEAVQTNTFDKTTLETIRSMSLQTPVGSVPLTSIATIAFENSRLTINHESGRRIAKVTAFTESGTTATDVFGAVSERMNETTLPDGYEVRLGGENEDINKSFADMFAAMILAVFLIAALMVLQFNSFKQMGLILMSIPLALIGVFPGLAILQLPLSFPGIIGIVALVGIVVNNAIILIDTINTNRAAGMEKEEAIVQAGKARLEPIFLTTITTVFGILPLAITEEVWRSLGFAIVFGLTCSTLLTLIVIPLLYRRFIYDTDTTS